MDQHAEEALAGGSLRMVSAEAKQDLLGAFAARVGQGA